MRGVAGPQFVLRITGEEIPEDHGELLKALGRFFFREMADHGENATVDIEIGHRRNIGNPQQLRVMNQVLSIYV